jgi:Domain of unknown function (DUF5615)
MTQCRFLIDECIPSALTRGLRRRIPLASVVQVGEADAPLKGTGDPDLLQFAEREQLLFITADRSTMIGHIEQHFLAGHMTWGVLLVSPRSSYGDILDDLCLIFEASAAEEWQNVLRNIPFS